VFEHDVEQQVRAVLTQAVDDVNNNPHLLPGIRLHFDLEFFQAYDSFAASRAGNCFTLVNAQNPLDTFSRIFPVDEEVANLLRTCWRHGELS